MKFVLLSTKLEWYRLYNIEPGSAVGGLSHSNAKSGVVSMLVSEMKKTLGEGGFFGNSPGSQIFDGMFEQLMGEEMARQGGFGLAKYVEANLNPPQKSDQASREKTDLEGTVAP